jgi:hypothetical protein
VPVMWASMSGTRGLLKWVCERGLAR